ncbi:hypothetical protein MKX01_024494, partial [Papaver californicum]
AAKLIRMVKAAQLMRMVLIMMVKDIQLDGLGLSTTSIFLLLCHCLKILSSIL